MAEGGRVEDLHANTDASKGMSDEAMKIASISPREAAEKSLHEAANELSKGFKGALGFARGGIVGKIMEKRKMAKGGECYSDGGEVSDDRTMGEMDEPEYGNLTYPDPDNVEHTEGMEEAPMDKRKMILGNIMRGIRSRHMGK